MDNNKVAIIVVIPRDAYCARFYDMEGTCEDLATHEKYPNIIRNYPFNTCLRFAILAIVHLFNGRWYNSLKFIKRGALCGLLLSREVQL